MDQTRATLRIVLASLACALAGPAPAEDATPPAPQAPQPVVDKSPDTTRQRLLEADKETGNWITHHKDYGAHEHAARRERRASRPDLHQRIL